MDPLQAGRDAATPTRALYLYPTKALAPPPPSPLVLSGHAASLTPY